METGTFEQDAIATVCTVAAAVGYLSAYFASVLRVGHERALTRSLPAALVMLVSLLFLARP